MERDSGMPATLSVVHHGAAEFGADADGVRKSKVDQVYSVLKKAIVSGRIAPDSSIDKGEWSARFEVSKLSVSAAVNRLAFERLVVIEPQRGSYVARIRLTDVKQWALVRRALELEVVAACARELSDEMIEQLGRNLAYQRTALDNGDLEGFHDLDTRFHRQMADGLGLGRVTEVLEPVCTHLERVRRTLLPEPGRMEATFTEHQSIQRTIAARRPGSARAAMGNHLDRVLHELERFVVRHPGYFEI
jgi:GntR family transcriptional regulator, rspAB operon transcriptional repressor